MTQPTIYFVRHGQTDWNVEQRLQGQMDIPINDTGRGQAAANGRALVNLIGDPNSYRYIASPLGRTRETMNIIRGELGLPFEGYETDDRLREISFGDWETFTFQELKKTEPERVAQRRADKWNFRAPRGESYVMLLERVKAWLPYVREDAVVVCHGGILRVLEHHLNGTPSDVVAQAAIPQDRIYRWSGDKAEWL